MDQPVLVPRKRCGGGRREIDRLWKKEGKKRERKRGR
jgi:hypothetical protein